MPLKQCFEIKKNDAGQEFDPFLVDIFLQNRRRIEKICEENNNKKELFRKQEKIDLSFIEFEILHLLMRSPGRMFSANYVQTECQFRYCGTAIPFLTVRSTAR